MKMANLIILFFIVFALCNKEERIKNSIKDIPEKKIFLIKEEKEGEVSLAGLKKVFDFKDNIFLSHLYRDGLYIPAGEIAFFKYTGGTWKSSWYYGEMVDEKKVSLTKGLQGIIRIPLQKEEFENGLSLRFSIKSLCPKQWLSLFVNENPHPAIEIGEEWKEYEIPLKREVLNDGENSVRFHFRRQCSFGDKKTSTAFEYIEFFGEKKDAPKSDIFSDLISQENILDLSKFKKIRYFISLPSSPYLYLKIQANSDFKIMITNAEKQTGKVIFEGKINKMKEILYNLNEYSNKFVVIDFINNYSDSLRLSEPAIYVKKEEKIKLGGEKPEYIIIWLADAMRADHLILYNSQTRVKTPNIERIGREGVVFKWASVQGGDSIPSHASILTSLYPRAHGHENPKTKIKNETILVSEVFKEKGFKTAIFSSNGYVSKKWGFAKGWDMYRNFIRENLPAKTDFLLPRAIKWIEGNISSPFFIYLTTVDTHVAYYYRKGFTDLYDPEPYKGVVGEFATGYLLEDIKNEKVKMTDRDKFRLEAQYDGEVTFNDYNFGKLLQFLEEKKILDKTLIVFTSDHGDEFFEHGSVGHGHSIYQELVGVPLVFFGPKFIPSGKVVDIDVEIIDIFPTIFEILGINPPSSFQGVSLLPLITDVSAHYPRPAMARMGALQVSLKIGNYKYIMKYGDNDGLYSLKESFYEKMEKKGQVPLLHRYFRDIISFAVSFEKIWKKREHGFFNNHSKNVFKDFRNIKF